MTHIQWLIHSIRAARDGSNVRIRTKDGFYHDMKPKEYIRWFQRRLDRKISGLEKEPTRQEMAWILDLRNVAMYYNQKIRSTGCRGLLLTDRARRRWPEVNNQEREH